MKRAKRKRPEELRDKFSKLVGMGIFSRAIRFVVLSNGDALALMEENFGRSWCIFATEQASKRITPTPVYEDRAEAEAMFLELVDAVTMRDRNRLEEEIVQLADAEPRTNAVADQVIAKAGQLLRLQSADEDRCDEREARDRGTLEDFSELSPEQQEAWLSNERDRVRERVRSRMSADEQAEMPGYGAPANGF